MGFRCVTDAEKTGDRDKQYFPEQPMSLESFEQSNLVKASSGESLSGEGNAQVY